MGNNIKYVIEKPWVHVIMEVLSCHREKPKTLTGAALQPLVSIIVPVYKVEDVLMRCLDSLCKQRLQDIEIILVDDASPDQCGEICESYASKDGRIKVFHHLENQGLSAARNTGIAHASAEYLMFVDSDDYVHEDFCKLPYECAVYYDADLVIFNNIAFKQGKPVNITNSESEDFYSGYKTHRAAIDLLLDNKVGVEAWDKLYKRKLFQDITYPIGYFYEDWGTTYKIILKATTIYYLDRFLYFWICRDDSITSLQSAKLIQDGFVMWLQMYRDLNTWGYVPPKMSSHLKNMALTYCIRKKRDFSDPYYVFCSKTIQSCEKIPEEFTWRRKAMFVLQKYCPSLFDLVCEISGKRW